MARDARDPAYTKSEQLFMLMKKQDKEELVKQLDPSAVFVNLATDMDGHQRVGRVMCEFAELAGKAMKYETTLSAKDMKTASTIFSVYDLRVQDTISINHSNTITKIVRKRLMSHVGTEESRKKTKAFLKSLIDGPVPKNGQLAPVLDYSYRELENAKQIFYAMPRCGKRCTLQSYEEQRELEAKAKEEAALALAQAETESVLMNIKARNKQGEVVGAYSFHKVEMLEEDEKDEEDDDGWGNIHKSSRQYETTAVKLANNNIHNPLRIDEALKKLCYNAFYFLTWIDISSNKLQEIPDFSQLPLIILYLHANEIRNVHEVKKLRAQEELQSLTLYGNPIQDTVPNYKYTVLNMLNQKGRPFTMKKFDFAVLTDRDHENMKALHDFTVGVSDKDRGRY
eukprot:TRINITY_DN12217_c0_g1_i1.p1 TRINITY_DN12217_c0_g1~~TRINITY_DN12217_c0_g1_i1.p1  ORF type:complete len:397 (+),score=199.85 TRINITY_DN12217_c0_g1_i1:73-1263(+)